MSHPENRHPPGAQTAFTLVELLIVVIILGILAAVVIPRFDGSVSEARESTLTGNLKILRQAIDLYQAEHGTFPGLGGWDEFVTQLTTTTDATGASGTRYGPYIRPPFPRNPVSQVPTGKTVAVMPAVPDGTTGWIYMAATGDLRANVSGSGPSGVAYFDL